MKALPARSVLLVLLAATAGLAAGWGQVAASHGDEALLDQEARDFGFASRRDYAAFFALDRNEEITSVSSQNLALLSRVSQGNPRFRPLVLNIAARVTREETANLVSKAVIDAAKDLEQKDSVESLVMTWHKRGFSSACETLQGVGVDVR